jgi:hypothetical protein
MKQEYDSDDDATRMEKLLGDDHYISRKRERVNMKQ